MKLCAKGAIAQYNIKSNTPIKLTPADTMPKLPVKESVSPSFARADAASYSFSEDRFAATTSAAKLAALLTQFQSRYPNASLVAELLTMHDNQFVVRALVQIGGAALTSGMAAATDIEQAEDRAKLRALEMLTLQPIAPIEPFSVRSEPTIQSGYDLQLRVTAPEPAIAPVEEPPASLPKASLPKASLPKDFSPALPVIEPAIEPAIAPIEERVVEPVPVAAGIPDIPLPTWEPEPQPQPMPMPMPEPEPEPEPIDMSDAIARTSVELKRLGWTNVKGREHLEKTYGKRSRQQLTDSELLDFLKFLESQSSPGQSPF